MSNFSKNLKSTFIERLSIQEPFRGSFNITKVVDPTTFDWAKKFSIRTELHADYVITRDTVDTEKHVIDDLKNKLIEHMFGEFRPLLYDLRHALYNRDLQLAIEIANKLEKQMYE